MVRNEVAYLKIINEFSSHLLKQDSIEGVAWSIVRDAIANLNFVDCVVYLIENGVLVQKAAFGPKSPIESYIHNPISIEIGEGYVGLAAQTGQYQWVSDTSTDERYIVDDELRYSELAVPIILEGEVIGVIDSEHPKKNFFTEEHLSILTTIATMAATKIAQERAKEALRQNNLLLEKQVQSRTQDLEKALEKLRNANQDLELFARSVSHDLRQPLRMVSNYTQLLKKRYLKHIPDEAQEFLDYAYEGAMQAQQLINDLLKYSSLGVKDSDFESVDLNQILQRVFINLDNEIQKIQPQVILPPTFPKINVVKTLILQLFQNIIHNAMKFKKDEPLTIEVRWEESELFYTFYIKDNGLGIPTQQHRHIFEIFARGEQHKTIEGTGLGLAMCKKIVHQHGGKIGVNSQEGVGSTFYFSIKKRGQG